MEWIDYRKEKPKGDIYALVCNAKGWMHNTKAIYHSRNDLWILDDPNYRDRLVLNVTHYLPTPILPSEDE